MAGLGECFSIGSTVSCTTCFKQILEGDVLAFDPATKMLILKCSKSGSNQLSDVFIVNLGLCSDVQVKNETNAVPETPSSLNLQRLNTRVRNSVEQKKRWVAAISAGVSPEGQKLYMAIAKTINHVTWDGSNIVVFNDVTIKPPYKVENISGHPDSRQLTYVKKMVERLTKDQQPAVTTAASVTATTHHSLAMMQSKQPLPQRQNSSGNGPPPNSAVRSHSSTLSAAAPSKTTITNANNIKAN